MSFKNLWQKSTFGFFIKNLLLAIAIIVAASWLTLTIIGRYTHHGEAETVPDLKGLYVEEAEILLKNHGLHLQVVDSVYDIKQALGVILEQTPLDSSVIKRNRPVFVVINSRQVRQIPLPDIVEVSYRQATAMLHSVGLEAGDIEYAPSEYKDLVISVKYRGIPVSEGMRLPEGSRVSLVVGGSIGVEQVIAPSLIGLNLDEGRNTALEGAMVIGAINYDALPEDNDSEYVIYRQNPRAGTATYTGMHIDIWLTRDKTKLDYEQNEDEKEEEFF